MEDWTETEFRSYAKKYNAVTIPVQLEIQGKHCVLSLKEVQRILVKAELIALGECDCRNKVKRCNSPLDTCLSLDHTAEKLINKGLAVKVDLKQALKVLTSAHEVGLVHITYTIAGEEKHELVKLGQNIIQGLIAEEEKLEKKLDLYKDIEIAEESNPAMGIRPF